MDTSRKSSCGLHLKVWTLKSLGMNQQTVRTCSAENPSSFSTVNLHDNTTNPEHPCPGSSGTWLHPPHRLQSIDGMAVIALGLRPTKPLSMSCAWTLTESEFATIIQPHFWTPFLHLGAHKLLWIRAQVVEETSASVIWTPRGGTYQYDK